MKAEDANRIYLENIDYGHNKIMTDIFSKIETLALQGEWQFTFSCIELNPKVSLRIFNNLKSLGYGLEAFCGKDDNIYGPFHVSDKDNGDITIINIKISWRLKNENHA